jgi:hypothetical protein
MSQTRNSQNFSLSYDQRLLLDLYIDFYNHTIRQMDSLQELQNEIRGNINQIVGLNQMRENLNSTQNSNTPRDNFRHNGQNHNIRISQEQRRRRNQSETINRRYMYYGNIPRLVPFDIPSADWQGRTSGRARENEQDNTFFSNLLRTFYDRIQVAPTRQQIEAATRIAIFSEIENPINNSCPVTLDRFENNSSVTQIIPCGHIFSPSGIDSWLQTSVRCPVCRYDIRDYIVNATTPQEPNVEEETRGNEETKEEDTLEESKNDSEEPIQERNSIPNQTNNSNRATFTSSDIQNTLSSITENILGQILNVPSNSATSFPIRNIAFDSSFNSLIYDPSNNQFIFEGILRR